MVDVRRCTDTCQYKLLEIKYVSKLNRFVEDGLSNDFLANCNPVRKIMFLSQPFFRNTKKNSDISDVRTQNGASSSLVIWLNLNDLNSPGCLKSKENNNTIKLSHYAII